jgi:hypothetical protein
MIMFNANKTTGIKMAMGSYKRIETPTINPILNSIV